MCSNGIRKERRGRRKVQSSDLRALGWCLALLGKGSLLDLARGKLS